MLNFPLPYQDELIYSTIARYGVHFGVTSPKQLLDDVYGNRKVIATTDLPNQLAAIVNHLNNDPRIDVEYLAYHHTLFPLYAPFVPEERRIVCLNLMAGNSRGAIHLALGIAASRVKQELALRYCPQCQKAQKQRFGEYYWQRLWQVKGADCCLVHGKLINAAVARHSYHRHKYFAASPANCPYLKQETPDTKALAVTVQVERLLNRAAMKSALFEQWTIYYKCLADKNNCSKGCYVKYEDIALRVIQCWSNEWLIENNVGVDDNQSCWLRSIFRKHRKSFSYLEHIIVLHTFLPQGWNINQVLNEVSQIAVESKIKVVKEKVIDEAKRIEYQQNWTRLVKQYGVLSARKKAKGGAIYAWLYRNDKPWLLALNKKYKGFHKTINQRVCWPKRDRQVVKRLLELRRNFIGQLNHPQMTQSWYLYQLSSASNVEKNLYRLPLCQAFLIRYCESTTDYQIRRVKRVVEQLNMPLTLKRWQVLRLAGLDEERIKEGTNEFLSKNYRL